MKRTILLTIIGFVATLKISYSQPNSVQPESDVLYQHGRNAGGTDPQENTDSVTVDGTTKYYVLPDTIVNPSFDYTSDLFANVISSFAWVVSPGISSTGAQPVTGYATAPHYRQITWDNTGTGTIQVTETADASQGGCVGSTLTTNIEVISKPDVTGISVSNTTCHTGTVPYNITCPDATLIISCAVRGNKGVVVNYSLTGPTGFTHVNNQTAPLGNSNTLDLSGITLTHPGTYILTINWITDRIATKSGLNQIADGTFTTFIVTAAPNTGPIYHLPNK